MKKLFLYFTIIFISNICYSQNRIGIQGGINYSIFRGYDISSFEPGYFETIGFGFLGGVYYEYQFEENLCLKLELNFERKTQKGNNFISLTDLNLETNYYQYNTNINLNYLVLPILLKYNFSDENSFYINGGPFIGYLLNSYFTNDSEDIEGFSNENFDSTFLYNRTDFGFSLGFGKTFDLNDENSIFLELRGNLGLTNISKVKVIDDGSIRTGSINFTFGYSFGID
jgi:Outer membrane protein beta-barrel domain